MNTLNETFKNARVILSLIWSVGKSTRVCPRSMSLEARLAVFGRHLQTLTLSENLLCSNCESCMCRVGFRLHDPNGC